MSDISDKQALVVTVKSSEYYDRFASLIGSYEKKLSLLDSSVTDLNFIQRKYVYLESIFSRGALPEETERFNKIDGEFVKIMSKVKAKKGKISALLEINGLTDTLSYLIGELEVCQKALNAYLEGKRNKFARLYFLGDDDLLEFLAKSQDKACIKNNLKKLYQGIVDIEVKDGKCSYFSSGLGENIALDNNVKIVEELEEWLIELTKGMQNTLASSLIQAMKAKEENMKYIEKYTAQVNCAVESVVFSDTAQENLSAAETLRSSVSTKIANLAVIQSSTADAIKLHKSKHLMLDLIHFREVAEMLVEKKINSTDSWEWFSQLKYSMKDNKLFVSMCDATFPYSYEYAGNSGKLVHTPLTDKCYLTLTQALHLGFGGNPYGPAGTGKTESVKALGQCLGRLVLVFNCDEGIDFKAMGRIFIGLVKSGSWGCFDEFNRLLEEQLSAISIQIQQIQAALKGKFKVLNLLNREIDVDWNSAVYVTLNPAGKGYGGRSKLPDNLKALFRPVAMSAPDNMQIARTFLYAEGFKHAESHSKKIVSLFSLCKDGLSTQIHYDWGLRSLKTILTVANQQLQKLLLQGKSLSVQEEEEILIKAISINVVSKLIYEDNKKFSLILEDVFPGTKKENISYEDIESVLPSAYEQLKVVKTEAQTMKLLQFHESLRQKMGVMLVGPSGCGKSSIWKLLEECYTQLGLKVKTFLMNPKSMDRSLLLGQMNHETGEYAYGVLTKCAREIEQEDKDTKCWIICDGDVDPKWIEALNSVLDDNRLLTMQNGERIAFGMNVNFIFETHSLEFASPATVSRMGIIYMNEEDLKVNSLVAAFLAAVDSKRAVEFKDWFAEVFEEAFRVAQRYSLTVSTTKYGFVNNFLKICGKAQSKQQFVGLLLRSIGASLRGEEKKEFAADLLSLAGESVSSADPSLLTFDNKMMCFVDIEEPSESLGLEEIETKKTLPIVMTKSFLRDKMMLEEWIEQRQPVLICGPEGCGKAILVKKTVEELNQFQVLEVTCTSNTNADSIIKKLSDATVANNTASGKIFRPKEANRMILFLRDINLPKPDEYATTQIVSFLQQIITYQGFYDNNLEFIALENIQLVCSMNPPSTLGRNKLTTRLTGLMRIMNIEYSKTEELVSIYHKLLSVALNSVAEGSAASRAYDYADSLVALYTSLREKLTQDNEKHYLFTPKDLSEVVMNLMRYKAETKEEVEEIFVYEVRRQFEDKLFEKDKNIFLSCLEQSMGRNSVRVDSDELIFSAFDEESSKYCNSNMFQRLSVEDYTEAAKKAKLLYERECSDVQFDFKVENLHNLRKIERIVSTTGKNLIMIGRSGFGRKKLIKLAGAGLGYEFFVLSHQKNYSRAEFEKDLKNAFTAVIQEEQKLIFYLEQSELAKEELVDGINSLLSSGEISGLLSNEEWEAFGSQLHDKFVQQSEIKSLRAFICSVIKANLKIVLSLEEDSAETSVLFLKNPALLSKCSIVSLSPPTKERLREVSTERLESTFKSLIKEGFSIVPEEIVESTLKVFESFSGLFSSQTLFYNLLDTFEALLNNNRSKFSESQERLTVGLDKLATAEEYVDKLKLESKQKEVVAEEKRKEADEALNEIKKTMDASAEERAQIEEINKEVEKEAEQVRLSSAKVEAELAEVMPEVNKALSLVTQLNSGKLADLRTYFRSQNIKAEVYYVLKALLQILGNNDCSWTEVKSKFGMDTISSLTNLDVTKVSKKNLNGCTKIVDKYASYFVRENAVRVNASLGQIADFISAIRKYAAAKENIKPLEEALEEAQDKMHETQKKLAVYQDKLADTDKLIAQHRETVGVKTREFEQINCQLQEVKDTVEKAEDLLSKLTGEKKRWKAQLSDIDSEKDSLVENCLFSAAFIVSLGFFNEAKREAISSQWKTALPKVKKDLIGILSKEAEILSLKKEGLPVDKLSVENSIILKHSKRPILLIDPIEKAFSWLQSYLKQANSTVETVSLNDEKIMMALELAMRFGKTLVVKDVDAIPLFVKDIVLQETINLRNCIRVGDKVVDMHSNFRLVLCSRSQSMALSSLSLSLFSTVNFSVTRSGLESSLLSLIVNIEDSALEEKKNELLEKEDALKLELSEIEKNLLAELNNLEGNLLENKGLIDSLKKSKEASLSIEKALTEGTKLQDEISVKRNLYAQLAAVSAGVYLSLGKLSNLNPMYEFSLGEFTEVLENVVKKGKDNDFGDIQSKIAFFMENLRRETFSYFSRAIFKEDLVSFGLFMCQIFSEELGLKEEEDWNFLQGKSKIPKNLSTPHWLPTEKKDSFNEFFTFYPDLENISSQLGSWFDSDRPEELSPTGNALVDLNLTKALRPDRLEIAFKRYICDFLSMESLSVSKSIADLYAKSNSKNPLMILVTAGADPSKELEDLASKQVGSDKFTQLSLGGSNQEEVIKILTEAHLKGHWIVLKNLHLESSLITKLNSFISTIEKPDFRLWITCESRMNFNSILLKKCVKLSYETPPGIKNNLKRIISQFEASQLDSDSVKKIFCLALLHALLQERRTYIPQGWVKFYEFSSSDLKISIDRYLGSEIRSVDILKGLLVNSYYGGRIDNDFDLALMQVYVEEALFNDGMLFGKYAVPSNSAEMERIIDNLPDYDNPSLFSLAENVDKGVQRYKSAVALKKLGEMFLVSSEQSKFSVELWQKRLSPFCEFWFGAIEKQELEEISNKLAALENKTEPVTQFLVTEGSSMLNLFNTINTDLTELNRLITRNALLSSRNEYIGKCLLREECPKGWKSDLAPLQLMKNIVAKLRGMKNMLEKAVKGNLLSEPVDLAVFLNPKTFLISLKQKVARESKVSIDTLRQESSFYRPEGVSVAV